MHFFDRFPAFLRTSKTGAWRERLICRYEAIIERNRERLNDARVLDIASHDARWTLAALDAGSQHVTGIEIRDELVAAGKQNLAYANISPDRYSFVNTDVFAATDLFNRQYDAILCLGFFYHTTRHEALFDLMSATGASTIILDTCISTVPGNFCEWNIDRVKRESAGDSFNGVRNDEILIARPTREVVQLMANHFGYRVTEINWKALLDEFGVNYDANQPHSADNPLGDYAAGGRTTFIATKQG